MTQWVFSSQVTSVHHGSVSAVAKLIIYRIANRQRAFSPKSGAFCIARDKLDVTAMHRLVTPSGQSVKAKAPDHWLWPGTE